MTEPTFADIEEALRNAARFAWVLPVVSGDDDALADLRTQALAAGLMRGYKGVVLVDWAMSECPA